MRLFGFQVLAPLSKRQWRSALVLFVAYVAATRLSAAVFTAPGLIFPASGIALAGLFLEGAMLWPFVFLASLSGYILSGSSPIYMLILPAAHTIQALVGATLLRRLDIDPLFRRLKDAFSLIAVALLASVIVPTLGTLARYLNYTVYNLPPSAVTWGSWYAATVFSVLIVTPFVIRWVAKPRLERNPIEWLEILSAFFLLSFTCYVLFWSAVPSIFGVSLVYFLLIPLFWIALRLRPRFLTLAFIVMSFFAFGGMFFGDAAPAREILGSRLFQMEIFLCILAVIFYILSSLEEERRVTGNLMRSQVSTLTEALTRVAGEGRAKSEFIAMLAHELRNPLAPIVSSIDILRLKEPEPEERKKLLELMDERVGTVRRLLDDLLDVSRITENKLSLQKEEVDLRTIIERAVLSTATYFDERNQSLTSELPREPHIIDADPVRIEQVISNLLTNASKFSEERGNVRLSVRARDGVVQIVVTDSGVGIDEKMLPRIFEPFLQVEQGERTRKGLGIGLSLVKSLVEMHEGTVRVKSDGMGTGSSFTVILPLLRIEQNAPVKSAKIEVSEVSRTQTGPSILVVDDNDTAAWGIGKLLELSGCKVGYAYDGEQALKKAEETKPDVILLDIGLPDMDGHEVAKRLRSEGYTGRLIALTGYSLSEDREAGFTSGFDEYLVKPIGFADLRRAIPLS